MLLQTDKLCKQYQRGEHLFYAVENISLAMEEHDFVCIIGRSGSGKSTLLNLVSGVLAPTCGEIIFSGIDLLSLDDSASSSLRNKYIGYVPQGASLLANLTVLDNLRLPFYLGSNKGDELARAHELLQAVGLSHMAHMYPASLSGGEARRVAIARALINTPKLLIADEPTSDLDIQTTDDVMQLLLRINQQGTALLLVTHELEITNYAKRVFKMESGILHSAD